MNTNANYRNYGIDALRIASAFFLIMHHLITQGGILSSCQLFSMSYFTAYTMEIIAYIFLDCFMLISGFVGINATVSVSIYLRLYLEVLFYSVLLSLVGFFTGNLSAIAVVKAFFPVNTIVYWYFTAYTLLTVVRPILNAFIKQSTNTKLFTIIALLICICSLPPFLGLNDLYSVSNGLSGIWLCIAYLIGALLNRLNTETKINAKKLLSLYFATVIFIVLSSILLMNVFPNYKEWLWRSPSSPFFVVAASSLLLLFSNITVSDSFKKWISILAPTSFGVYLIHVHPFLFQQLSNSFKYIGSFYLPFMVIAIIGICIAYYLFCVCIELIRLKFFEVCRISKSIKRIDSYANGIYQKLQKAIH